MNISTDTEKILFKWILKNPIHFKSVKSGFFDNENLDWLAKIAKKFYNEFSESPTKDQILAITREESGTDYDDIVNSSFDVNLDSYEKEWLNQLANSTIQWKNFNRDLADTIQYVKTTEIDLNNVVDVINKARDKFTENSGYSLDSDLGLNFFNENDHFQKSENKIRSGFSFIDDSIGGYDPKTLVVYCGESGIGKSIWLANDAARFIQQGKNVVFITAEMSEQKILKRIGSNLLNIRMNEYDTISNDKREMSKRLKKLKSNGGNNGLMDIGKLWIKMFPTSQSSVLDIDSYIKELQEAEEFKIDILIVDYINILSNYRNPNTENTYMKIKQISEDLRAIAQKRDLLIISATQINRTGFNTNDLTLENIAESAGLIHTCDMIYAIIQDGSLLANNSYILKVLKIRDGSGKNRKCEFDIDYSHMRLSEKNSF